MSAPSGVLVPARDSGALGACAMVSCHPQAPHVLLVAKVGDASLAVKIDWRDFERFCEAGLLLALAVRERETQIASDLPPDLPRQGKDFEP